MKPTHIGLPGQEPIEPERCRTVNDVLTRIGDTWSVQVMMQLGAGPLRFSELHRKMAGVSKNMLTRTLRALERDGLVEKSTVAAKPLQVRYTLSALGLSLHPIVTSFGDWALRNHAEINAAQARFDSTGL